MNYRATAESNGLQEERLRDLRDRLSISLAAAGAVGSWDWDIANRLLHLDARLAAFQGIDAAGAAEGLPVSQFFTAIHPNDVPRIRVAVAGMLRGAEVFFKSYRMIAPDRSVRWVEAHGRCLLDEEDQPERFFGVLVDTTARQRIEERLRIAQTAGGVGTFEYVPGFSTTTVSEQFCQLLGLEPSPMVPVASINDLVVDGGALLKNRPERVLEDGEYRVRRADTGELRWIARRGEVLTEGEGSVGRQIGVIFDITDLKRAQEELAELNRNLEKRVEQEIQSRQHAEERLRQAQKMEAIGQLTGGIAHDFNNLLTVIIGNVDMARRRLGAGADERIERALASALKSSERAASLTERLLAFSRRQPLDPTPVDVSRLVHGMFDLLNRSLGEQIEIRTEFEPDLWCLEADANQLESAVLNLAVNARDAMDWQGVLSVSASNLTIVESSVEQDALAPGDYVVLSISDNGRGMPADVVKRAFEPFFTTKEVGKGTGLGLSMVFGFVRQTGGDVRIESNMGSGTTIKILLPRCIDVSKGSPDGSSLAVVAASRRATVLVVEDDADVRAFTSDGLRELGYEVLEAADGAEALSLLDGKAGIDLLLTDVIMPGLSGRELAEKARERDPDLLVLYMSGYPGDVIARNGRLESGVVLLSKPFTMQALATRVQEVIEEQRTAPGSNMNVPRPPLVR